MIIINGAFIALKVCVLWLNVPFYIKPMRHFGETIKYNYVSLITHSSAGRVEEFLHRENEWRASKSGGE